MGPTAHTPRKCDPDWRDPIEGALQNPRCCSMGRLKAFFHSDCTLNGPSSTCSVVCKNPISDVQSISANQALEEVRFGFEGPHPD